MYICGHAVSDNVCTQRTATLHAATASIVCVIIRVLYVVLLMSPLATIDVMNYMASAIADRREASLSAAVPLRLQSGRVL